MQNAPLKLAGTNDHGNLITCEGYKPLSKVDGSWKAYNFDGEIQDLFYYSLSSKSPISYQYMNIYISYLKKENDCFLVFQHINIYIFINITCTYYNLTWNNHQFNLEFRVRNVESRRFSQQYLERSDSNSF